MYRIDYIVDYDADSPHFSAVQRSTIHRAMQHPTKWNTAAKGV